MYQTAVWVLCFSAALLVYKLGRIGRRERYLPNGPPTVPLLGNLNIFPSSKAYIKFTEWARIYGGIYSLKIGPATAIVLTDLDIVKELLDKRSQATADRPPFYAGELVCEGMHLALARYTKQWRTQRRVVQEALTQSACIKYVPIQQAESIQLVHDCLVLPQDFYQHTSRYAFSVILSILFGERTPRHDTQNICDFNHMERLWQKLLAPGNIPPVELLPFLKYTPRKFAQWRVDCDVVKELQQTLYMQLLRKTQERLARGEENGSFIEEVLARQTKYELEDLQVAQLGGAMIEGGAGTSSAWIKFLIMAMVTHPGAQEKAHEELDRIIGRERMPTLNDLSQLPYIRAVVKEVDRWRPVAPLAGPHAANEEIVYGGYRIPVGTTIFTNVWGISHDPERYERPEDFWPDRWILHEFGLKPEALGPNVKPPIFGSGRRICPGSHLAEISIAINTMNLLWAFDFRPSIDEHDGSPIPIDTLNLNEGLTPFPIPFACDINPRSSYHTEIIQHEFLAARSVFKQYEHN